MSKRQHSKDEESHRGRDEAPSGRRGEFHHRGSRRGAPQSSSSTTQARGSDERTQRRSPREGASQSSAYATQPLGSGQEHRAETSESVFPSQPFGPIASMASMRILSSGFTPTVAPARNTSLPTVLVSTVPPPRPDSLRDKEHCGACDAIGDVTETSMEWWKIEHLKNKKECRMAYRLGTCLFERTDLEIEARDVADKAFRATFTSGGPKDTRGPAQTHAPQMTGISAWSQGASQPSTQPQIANPAYSNFQSNNPSTIYNPSAGYSAPAGQTTYTGYVPSSYASQPAPYYSGNTGYIAPGSMLPPPIPHRPSNAAPTSYTAPPGPIPIGLNPSGYTTAARYAPPPARYTSSNIPEDTQQQASYQPAASNPRQCEQYAPTTSSAQQDSSHRGSSRHGKHSKK
ncbi:hypothetical protein EAE96_007719 [Botrytis aclada]|nr:hypothetical protein EAE96_007719 [Botrytis aclada]